MDELLRMCLIVCPFIFVAGFVDSVAGGGGVISITGAMLAGLPVHMAVGTNKTIMCFGTAVSTAKYFKGGKILLRAALFSAAGSLIGAAAGSSLALLLSEEVLRLILLIALPSVAVFLTLKRNIGADDSVPKPMSGAMQSLLSFAIGLFIGTYDGLIGPGTGTFLIIAFSGILGLDLLTSSGCAKMSNLASNLASMIVYISEGKVLFAVAIPAMVFCMAGNWLGARYAMRGGSKKIRRVMFFVLGLLFIKVILELFGIEI